MAYTRKRRPMRRKNKRWYVDASGKLPWGVGDVKFKAGSGLEKRGLIRKVVRSEMAKTEESKYIQYKVGIATPNWLNDSISTMAPTQLLTVGTSNQERIGNSIFLKHIVLQCTVLNSATQLNGKVRVIGFYSDKLYTQANIGNSVQASDLFIGNSHRLVNADYDNNLDHKVICDKTFNIKSPNALSSETLFKIHCPIFKKEVYHGPYFKDKQLYFVFIPSVAGMAQTANTTWTLTVQSLLTYRDS